jgi:hypothetical protein
MARKPKQIYFGESPLEPAGSAATNPLINTLIDLESGPFNRNINQTIELRDKIKYLRERELEIA